MQKVNILAALFVNIAMMFFKPYVLQQLWLTFVTRLGAPAISYWTSFGIGLTIAFLTAKWPSKDEQDNALGSALGLMVFAVLALILALAAR